MCRFKEMWIGEDGGLIEFQYILCVGSREVSCKCLQRRWVSIHPMCRFKCTQVQIESVDFGFNTSYVSVQVGYRAHSGTSFDPFQYILCVGSRVLEYLHIDIVSVFQYILCVGSRFMILV